MLAVIRGVARFIGVLPAKPPPSSSVTAPPVQTAPRFIPPPYIRGDREPDFRNAVIAYHNHLTGVAIAYEPRLTLYKRVIGASAILHGYWQACVLASTPLRRPAANMDRDRRDLWLAEYEKEALTDVATWTAAQRVNSAAIMNAKVNVLPAPAEIVVPYAIQDLIAERAAAALARRSRTTTAGGGEPPASAVPAAPPVPVPPVTAEVDETEEPATPKGPK